MTLVPIHWLLKEFVLSFDLNDFDAYSFNQGYFNVLRSWSFFDSEPSIVGSLILIYLPTCIYFSLQKWINCFQSDELTPFISISENLLFPIRLFLFVNKNVKTGDIDIFVMKSNVESSIKISSHYNIFIPSVGTTPFCFWVTWNY